MNRFRWAVVLLVSILCVAAVFMNLVTITAEIPTAAALESKPVIIIDAGHGGIDGGAVSNDGAIIEKDVNLNISLYMRDMFLLSGFDVIMTRESDISIHDEGVSGIKQQKTSDLHNRLALTESVPDCIYISIHQNKFGQASSRGSQIFYSPNNPESAELAQIIQEQIVSQLQYENNRHCKEAGKNLYLMYEAKCPAVLVECGFLSNPEEAHMLNDSEYQSRLAFVIYGSVMEYLTPPLVQGEIPDFVGV